jgi:hypothetical protein
VGYEEPDERDWSANIPLFLLLTLVTAGVFNLFWNYRQMQACNAMLGRREFSWLRWIVLSILTLLLYHIYYQYKMGAAIVEIQRNYEEPVFEELPLVSLLATIFGFSIAADCIHQYELNKLVP